MPHQWCQHTEETGEGLGLDSRKRRLWEQDLSLFPVPFRKEGMSISGLSNREAFSLQASSLLSSQPYNRFSFPTILLLAKSELDSVFTF